jgi:predicted NBD/HSP70 family sugar kinase
VRGATYSAGEVGYTHIGEPGIFENLAATSALIREVAAAKNLEESHEVDDSFLSYLNKTKTTCY